MKSTVVKMNIVKTENSWNPEHYLGYSEGMELQLAERRLELKKKKAKIDLAMQELEEEHLRLARLMKNMSKA